MAKNNTKQDKLIGQRKKHGVHSINKSSNHKNSKNYRKKYRGQGGKR